MCQTFFQKLPLYYFINTLKNSLSQPGIIIPILQPSVVK